MCKEEVQEVWSWAGEKEAEDLALAIGHRGVIYQDHITSL